MTERQVKNFTLLELIRRGGPITRTQLSQQTNLNIVTVSNYVADFIKKGLVVERGLDVSTGGRKPTLVELNATAGYAAGLDLGLMDLRQPVLTAVVTDLRGHVVHRLAKPRAFDTMDHILEGVEPAIQELLSTCPIEPKKIQALGLGIPGIHDERAGTIRHTTFGGKRTNYHAVRERLEERFRIPMFIGNDATLAGYGELRLGLDRPVENLVYLYGEVGAGLIVHGNVYWGAGGSAGEVGVVIPSADDYLMWAKDPSLLQPFAWHASVPLQAQKLIEEGHQTAMMELAERDGSGINLDTVLEAAQQGDGLAQELVEHLAMRLGIRIACLVNLFNPEVVIIGGGIEKAGSLVLEPVWRCVKRYAYEESASLVDILPAQLGQHAVAMGAACWVIREVFLQT